MYFHIPPFKKTCLHHFPEVVRRNVELDTTHILTCEKQFKTFRERAVIRKNVVVVDIEHNVCAKFNHKRINPSHIPSKKSWTAVFPGSLLHSKSTGCTWLQQVDISVSEREECCDCATLWGMLQRALWKYYEVMLLEQHVVDLHAKFMLEVNDSMCSAVHSTFELLANKRLRLWDKPYSFSLY